jgi:hypothetical protein
MPAHEAMPLAAGTQLGPYEVGLDKRPEARFQSSSDLAFALESPSGTSSGSLDVRPPVAFWTGRRRRLVGASVIATTAVLAATDQARFSPDGRWIAYDDIESGRLEVFVVPFPPTGERWQISTSAESSPSGGVMVASCFTLILHKS